MTVPAGSKVTQYHMWGLTGTCNLRDSTGKPLSVPIVKGNLHGLAIQSNIIVPLKSIFCHGNSLKLDIGSAIGLPTAVAQTHIVVAACSVCNCENAFAELTMLEGQQTRAYLVSSYRTPHFLNCPLTEKSSCRVSNHFGLRCWNSIYSVRS